jgi:hypothetical protein
MSFSDWGATGKCARHFMQIDTMDARASMENKHIFHNLFSVRRQSAHNRPQPSPPGAAFCFLNPARHSANARCQFDHALCQRDHQDMAPCRSKGEGRMRQTAGLRTQWSRRSSVSRVFREDNDLGPLIEVVGVQRCSHAVDALLETCSRAAAKIWPAQGQMT